MSFSNSEKTKNKSMHGQFGDSRWFLHWKTCFRFGKRKCFWGDMN